MKSTSGRLSEVHDRLATLWRRALREPPPEPNEADLAELGRMFIGQDGDRLLEPIVKSYPERLAQVLQLVESGPVWRGLKIDWPAPSTPEFRQDKMDPRDLRYAVRLTPRGGEALKAVMIMPPGTSEYEAGLRHKRMLRTAMLATDGGYQ